MKPEEQLSATVQTLLNQCREQIAPHTLNLLISGPDSLTLNPTASQIVKDQEGNYVLTVPNPRFANFIVAHELLHLQQETSQSIQVGPVDDTDKQMANFLAVFGQIILETILHQAMLPRLKAMGVLDQPAQNAIREYASANLMHDDDLPAGSEGSTVTGNVLQIVGARVLLDAETLADTSWSADFPRAWSLAQTLQETWLEKPLTTNRQLRAALMRVLNLFMDKKLIDEQIDLGRHLTVTAVLSPRELNLKVSQLFHFYHQPEPELADLYLLLGDKDEQCVGTFKIPVDQQGSEAMHERYEQRVEDFLNEHQIEYAQRDGHYLPEQFPGEQHE
ncbi:hypothetical protein [Lapidilactobacillus salsurivasis]